MVIIVNEDDPRGGVHYSFGSIVKTFWHILGIPNLNQYDGGAPIKIFVPEKALNPLDEDFDRESLHDSLDMDHPETMQKWMREDNKERTKLRK